jgi:hypothetical protein
VVAWAVLNTPEFGMQKVVLTFGLIAGAFLALMMWVTIPFIEKIGTEKSMAIGYTTMVLAGLMIFFGIKSYRDNVGGGSVGFGRAFGIGMTITAISTACYVASWEVLWRTQMPDFAKQYAARAISEAEKAGKPAAEVAKMKTDMEKFAVDYENPLFRIPMTFLEPLPVGLLMSLIAAGTLRRQASSQKT